MTKYKTAKQVWAALDRGQIVNWHHAGYKVYREKARAGCEYQNKHWTYREGYVLSVRCIENYFGSLMDPSDIRNLFSKSDATHD